jgi:hypothetical protein
MFRVQFLAWSNSGKVQLFLNTLGLCFRKTNDVITTDHLLFVQAQAIVQLAKMGGIYSGVII